MKFSSTFVITNYLSIIIILINQCYANDQRELDVCNANDFQLITGLQLRGPLGETPIIEKQINLLKIKLKEGGITPLELYCLGRLMNENHVSAVPPKQKEENDNAHQNVPALTPEVANKHPKGFQTYQPLNLVYDTENISYKPINPSNEMQNTPQNSDKTPQNSLNTPKNNDNTKQNIAKTPKNSAKAPKNNSPQSKPNTATTSPLSVKTSIPTKRVIAPSTQSPHQHHQSTVSHIKDAIMLHYKSFVDKLRHHFETQQPKQIPQLTTTERYDIQNQLYIPQMLSSVNGTVDNVPNVQIPVKLQMPVPDESFRSLLLDNICLAFLSNRLPKDSSLRTNVANFLGMKAAKGEVLSETEVKCLKFMIKHQNDGKNVDDTRSPRSRFEQRLEEEFKKAESIDRTKPEEAIEEEFIEAIEDHLWEEEILHEALESQEPHEGQPSNEAEINPTASSTENLNDRIKYYLLEYYFAAKRIMKSLQSNSAVNNQKNFLHLVEFDINKATSNDRENKSYEHVIVDKIARKIAQHLIMTHFMDSEPNEDTVTPNTETERGDESDKIDPEKYSEKIEYDIETAEEAPSHEAHAHGKQKGSQPAKEGPPPLIRHHSDNIDPEKYSKKIEHDIETAEEAPSNKAQAHGKQKGLQPAKEGPPPLIRHHSDNIDPEKYSEKIEHDIETAEEAASHEAHSDGKQKGSQPDKEGPPSPVKGLQSNQIVPQKYSEKIEHDIQAAEPNTEKNPTNNQKSHNHLSKKKEHSEQATDKDLNNATPKEQAQLSETEKLVKKIEHDIHVAEEDELSHYSDYDSYYYFDDLMPDAEEHDYVDNLESHQTEYNNPTSSQRTELVQTESSKKVAEKIENDIKFAESNGMQQDEEKSPKMPQNRPSTSHHQQLIKHPTTSMNKPSNNQSKTITPANQLHQLDNRLPENKQFQHITPKTNQLEILTPKGESLENNADKFSENTNFVTKPPMKIPTVAAPNKVGLQTLSSKDLASLIENDLKQADSLDEQKGKSDNAQNNPVKQEGKMEEHTEVPKVQTESAANDESSNNLGSSSHAIPYFDLLKAHFNKAFQNYFLNKIESDLNKAEDTDDSNASEDIQQNQISESAPPTNHSMLQEEEGGCHEHEIENKIEKDLLKLELDQEKPMCESTKREKRETANNSTKGNSTESKQKGDLQQNTENLFLIDDSEPRTSVAWANIFILVIVVVLSVLAILGCFGVFDKKNKDAPIVKKKKKKSKHPHAKNTSKGSIKRKHSYESTTLHGSGSEVDSSPNRSRKLPHDRNEYWKDVKRNDGATDDTGQRRDRPSILRKIPSHMLNDTHQPSQVPEQKPEIHSRLSTKRRISTLPAVSVDDSKRQSIRSGQIYVTPPPDETEKRQSMQMQPYLTSDHEKRQSIQSNFLSVPPPTLSSENMERNPLADPLTSQAQIHNFPPEPVSTNVNQPLLSNHDSNLYSTAKSITETEPIYESISNLQPQIPISGSAATVPPVSIPNEPSLVSTQPTVPAVAGTTNSSSSTTHTVPVSNELTDSVPAAASLQIPAEDNPELKLSQDVVHNPIFEPLPMPGGESIPDPDPTVDDVPSQPIKTMPSKEKADNHTSSLEAIHDNPTQGGNPQIDTIQSAAVNNKDSFESFQEF